MAFFLVFFLYKYALFLYNYAFCSLEMPFSYNIVVKNAKFLAFFGIISEEIGDFEGKTRACSLEISLSSLEFP